MVAALRQGILTRCIHPEGIDTRRQEGKNYMNRMKQREFKKKILVMVLVPFLIAVILFAVSAPAYIAARSQVKVFSRFGGPAARIEPEDDNFYQ